MTPYQRKRQEEDRRVWRAVKLSAGPIDKPRAEETIRKIRRVERPGDGSVEFVWCDSPMQCLKRVFAYTGELSLDIGRAFDIPYVGFAHAENAILAAINEIVFKPMNNGRGDVTVNGFRKSALVGQFLASKYQRDKLVFEGSVGHTPGYVSNRAFFEVNLELLADVVRDTSFFFNFDHYVFASERPTSIEVDDRNRLHSRKGPALAWGAEKYYWIHGVEIPEKYVLNPRTINPPIIDATKNVEVRRVLMEMYGIDKYLQNTGAVVISEGHYGKRLWWRGPEHETPEQANVWRVLRRVPEPLVMVEVVNSTPESDGSFKRYFLRVPPNIRDADEAVAWTFRLKKEDYHPDVET